MTHRATVLPRLLALLAALMLAALVGASSGQAAVTPWGDLGHFGELESELKAPEPAFGVNPTDGSVWVVDRTGTAGKEELRIQKFEKKGSTWSVVASHLLGSIEDPNESGKEVEGVAFDTSEKRAYVLVTQERQVGGTKGEQAASELWAFSTETKEGKIEPASGTNGGVLVPRNESTSVEGVVGKKEFAPDAKLKGSSLISPSGIAVNPVTHQILVTGWVGTIERPESQLWAVTDAGEIKTVWEDKTKFFEGCGCVSSPVVTAAGNIYVLGEEEGEIYELPSTLASATPPKQAYLLPHFKECEIEHRETCSFLEKIAFIESGTEELGGEMTLGPEGDLYVHVEVRNASEGNFTSGGVLVLTPSLQEVGWTGGGSWGSATKECAVNEKNTGNNGPSLLGAYEKAGEQKVLMFERGLPLDGEHAKILELGPGGKAGNCPHGTVTKPSAEVGGLKVESVPVADTVRFSSELTQANAVTSEWEFGDGSAPQKVEKRQQQTTLVEHQFTKGGTLEIKEHINTDDLATPELNTAAKLTIVTPQVKAEAATTEGTTEATIKGEVNPMLSPTKCEFQVVEAGKSFGDASAKKIAYPKAPGEEEKFVVESTKVSGLTSGTCYAYRLLAKAGAWESAQTGNEFKAGGGVCTGAKAPAVETTAASEIASTTATLNGTINPKGVETKSCVFEYGTSLPSGKTAACSPKPGKGESPEAVSAKVTALTPATIYKYKLIDESSEAVKVEGGEISFTTKPAPEAPAVEDLAPESVTQTSATLKANVNPHGEATTCQFEYGTTNAYGTTVACPTAPGSGTSNVAEALPVSGLLPSTTYHYRVVAKNGTGSTNGADKEFATLATVPPVVETKAATEITATAATLNGAVNPKGIATKACTFEYGTSLPSGKTESCSPAPGSGQAAVAVSAKIASLTANTTYKFKLIDESAEAKKAEGGVLEFKTSPPPEAPAVEELTPSPIGQTSATLRANVNPHGEATTCTFEYGTTASYGTTVPCPTAPGAGNGNVEVSLPVTGLSAGTTYHFRVTATNKLGTLQGTDRQFATEAGSGNGNGGGGGQNNGGGGQNSGGGQGGVAHEQVPNFQPIVTIAGAAMTVAPNGAFSLKLSCPSAETTCSGTVTVKTASAVAARSAHAAKKAILTLATASFTITAGKVKVLSMHLTAKAKKLLAKLHTVRARVTIVAHDPQGHTHTTTAAVTLRAAKKKH